MVKPGLMATFTPTVGRHTILNSYLISKNLFQMQIMKLIEKSNSNIHNQYICVINPLIRYQGTSNDTNAALLLVDKKTLPIGMLICLSVTIKENIISSVGVISLMILNSLNFRLCTKLKEEVSPCLSIIPFF